MKRLVLGLAATVSLIALVPAAEAAPLISLGVSINGGAINTVATDGGSGFINYNSSPGTYTINFNGAGSPAVSQPNILTNALAIAFANQNTAGSIDLYITQQGLNSFNGNLLSSFTSNTSGGFGAITSVTLSSVYSAANALWTGTPLQSQTFNGVGTFQGTNGLNVTGPYSETLKYHITFNAGAGNFNGTANLSAVPEPATWGLMLLGFGAMGGMLRTRRRTARIRFA